MLASIPIPKTMTPVLGKTTSPSADSYARWTATFFLSTFALGWTIVHAQIGVSKIALGSDSVYTYLTPIVKDSTGHFLEFLEFDSLADGKWIVYQLTTPRIFNKSRLEIIDTTIYYYDSTEIAFIGYYKNHKKDSIWLYFWTNTKPMIKATYINGKLSGRYIMWFDSGKIALDCNYKDGILCGAYKKYKYDGTIQIACFYENGIIKKDYLKNDSKNKQTVKTNKSLSSKKK